jgi:hypothetical protein
MTLDPPQAAGRSHLLPCFLLAFGFIVRLWLSHAVFLNPDEALHYWLSLQPSLALTYQATMVTAHPPLYIVMLHYLSYLGSSEFLLRLPSVLAGTALCWVVFLWLERVTSRATALIGLGLLLFSPSLIYVSAEVRQYAPLLLFCAGALYFFDSALAENSLPRMALSSIFLWLALLTHYSALLFALALGFYALLRIAAVKPPAKVLVTWILSQLFALALVAVLFRTHISLLKAQALPEKWADTYLRGSIFHPSTSGAVTFVFKATLQLFHYLFSQGAVGILGLLLFAGGVILLWREQQPRDSCRPSPRHLAFLLVFPLVVNCALGLAGKYPYGGSRHDSYLALFVMPGIAVALARWRPQRRWINPAAIGVVLLICNLFPSPAGQYIRLKDQRKELMESAVNYLQENAPPGSVVLTDSQGGLLLSYYLCHEKAVLLTPPYAHYFAAPCGQFRLLSLDSRLWMFSSATFPDELRTLEQNYGVVPERPVWLAQAKWMTVEEKEFRAQLPRLGCPDIRDFGENILVCRLTLPGAGSLPLAGGRLSETQ